MKRFRHGWAVLAALLTLILASSPWSARAARVVVTTNEIVGGVGISLTGAVAKWTSRCAIRP